jgi:hypothetical protein
MMRRDIVRNRRLKTADRGILAILVLALMMHTVAIAAERQGPRIYVQEGRFDLGTVEQGAVPEHIFEIKNLGDEVLEIGRVQPT